MRLSVTVDPSPARLSDEPTLTLEIAYAQGITVHKPEFGSALGEFVIRDFREPLPRIEGDRQILQQIYTLEPTRAGKFVIDPISITFLDDQAGGSGKEHTLQTEPITVEVAAAVAQEAPSLDQLRGPAEPLPLPQSSSAARWWIAVAGGRRPAGSGRGVVVAPPQADAVCRRAHARRTGQTWNCSACGRATWPPRDVKLFYVELTAIVRRYIERTKGIHAPEQTTQEFLQEISRRKDFPAEQSRRLRSFLEAADLVKFAAHQPREEDVEESFRRASAFVGSRRPRGGCRMSFRFQSAAMAAVAARPGRDRRAGDPPAAPRGRAVLRREHPADTACHAGLADQAGLPWVRLLGLALVIVALARPQRGIEEFRLQTEGIAIQMCIDHSYSMSALDFNIDGQQVNRLDVVKRVFHDFVMGKGKLPGRPDDLIGLITFGGFVEPKCPLTLDHGALVQVLDSVEIPHLIFDSHGRVVNEQLFQGDSATAIGDALAIAAKRLKDCRPRARSSFF